MSPRLRKDLLVERLVLAQKQNSFSQMAIMAIILTVTASNVRRGTHIISTSSHRSSALRSATGASEQMGELKLRKISLVQSPTAPGADPRYSLAMGGLHCPQLERDMGIR